MNRLALSGPFSAGCIVVCMLLSLQVFSQPEIMAGSFYSVPIKRSKNLLMVEAGIDSLCGYFILDTGIPDVVLNTAHFGTRRKGNENSAADVSGKVVSLVEVRMKNFSLGPISISNLKVQLTDLSHIEQSRDIEILGLIGFRALSLCNLVVDVRRSMLFMQLRGIDGGKGEQHKSDMVFEVPEWQMSFDNTKGLIMVQARIGEKVKNFCVDTGCEAVMISDFVGRSIKREFQPVRRINLVTVGGQQHTTRVGILRKLSVGSLVFEKIPVLCGKPYKMQPNNDRKVDGIMGYPLFTKGIVSIDFDRHIISVYSFDSKPGKAYERIIASSEGVY